MGSERRPLPATPPPGSFALAWRPVSTPRGRCRPAVAAALGLALASVTTLAACAAGGDTVEASGPGRVATSTTTEAPVPVIERPEYLRGRELCEDAPAVHDVRRADGPAVVALDQRFELEDPVAVTFADDGTALVGTRQGRVRRWTGAGVPVEVLDLSDDTSVENDQGLLGLDLSPDGEWLHVNRTTDDGTSRFSSFPVIDGVPVDDEQVLLQEAQPSRLHNGGDVVAAADGTVFVSFGDGGGLGDRWYHGQNPTTRLGAVLRLEPRPGEDPPYAVPVDNPFVDDPGTDDLIWAMGVRNPFRMSLDEATGTLWVADFGQRCVEEITALGPDEAGANLGWNAFEGDRPYVGELAEGDRHRPPDLTYWHTDDWCGVVGGEVYRGEAIPRIAGWYLFADFCTGEIVGVDPESDEMVTLGASTRGPVDLTSGPDGELYVVSQADGLSALVPARR